MVENHPASQTANAVAHILPDEAENQAVEREGRYINDVCHDVIASGVVAAIVCVTTLLREYYTPARYVPRTETATFEVLYLGLG